MAKLIALVLTFFSTIGSAFSAPVSENYALSQPLPIFGIEEARASISSFGFEVHQAPTLKPQTENFSLEASSAIVIDRETGKVLFEKQADRRQAFASITKLMTALITRRELALNDVISVPHEATKVTGSKSGLREGGEFTIYDLLYSLLLESGNDTAHTLAMSVSGDIGTFVGEMNRSAAVIGLDDTHFTNPYGFDSDYHYSTPRDLAKLVGIILDDPILAEIVSQSKKTIHSLGDNQVYNLKSTNVLLGDDELHITGVKTGTTSAAGESLATSSVDNEGHELIAIILNSTDRFGEMKELIKWTWDAYLWHD